jgi:hypothetical protein
MDNLKVLPPYFIALQPKIREAIGAIKHGIDFGTLTNAAKKLRV